MRVIFSCGGTGGHIYPAIAVADKITEKRPDAEILFIGTLKGMENDLVPKAGYEIRGIDASGFNRKHLMANVSTLRNLLKGGNEAGQIIHEFRPDIAFGTGGYVTGSVINAAHRQHVRCFIHEQNAFPGLANKLLEPMTEKTFISFADSAKYFRHPDKLVLSGNPVRADFGGLSQQACREKLGLKDELMILVFGGSLGAETINASALRLIEEIRGKNIKLYFVTGKRYYDEVKREAEARGLEQTVLIPYADNMPELMCASDIVVSRAGAIAVSEIMVCGRPSVLIPSPNVTNNHQYYNAKAVADAGAAALIEEKDLLASPELLSKALLKLEADPAARLAMQSAAKAAAKPDAADIIFNELGI